ncbi:MAG TPA: serine/threonine-protein kinase [Longilinea sp.]|nr:serine/threonine-protein kinase [Longilinea sp.]
MERAIMCPQCNAPLTPHPFANSAVCSYCGATVQLDVSSISAERFHDSYRVWNSPTSYPFPAWLSMGDSHWAVHQMIGQGDSSDVYTAQRARWPTELVVVKTLRDEKDAALLENEWRTIQILLGSQARGADTFSALMPQSVIHGKISDGQFNGKHASIFRWQSGFRHTLADVIKVYPQGIPPRAVIWVWRRILESLSFIHSSGMVHGAILPEHLLVQGNEHGIRLVGFGYAGKKGDRLPGIVRENQGFYPGSGKFKQVLSPQLDLCMSARCLSVVLGGDPSAQVLPAAVPAPIASVIMRVARLDPDGKPGEDAWSIREELGQLAKDVFGPSQFIPIVMPD